MGQKGLATRSRIIESTYELLKKKSLQDISVREICDISHIAKGTFYVHFQAKEDIAWAILDYKFEGLISEFSAYSKVPASVKSLEALIDFVFYFSSEHVGLLQLIHHVRFTEFIGKDKLEAKYSNFFATMVQEFVQHGVDNGLFFVQDVEFTSYYLAVSIHALIDQVIYSHSPYNLQKIKEETKRIIMKLLL